MKPQKLLIVFVIVLIYGCADTNNTTNAKIQTTEKNQILKNINLPEGFEIGIFASELGKSLFSSPGPNQGARFMEFYNGALFVSVPSAGSIIALPDKDKDGKADAIIKVIDNLNRPHGIAFKDDYIYVANEDSVIKAKLKDDLTADKSTIEHITDLPRGGHWTRTIRIKEDKLYVSIGSSCNVCIENDERRASILKCALDGNCKVYAKGIRNAVGFVFHPETDEIYATENSRDWLGDELPPDEINIVKDGKNYGWPICYGKNIHDADFDKNTYIRNPCMEPFEEPSFIDLQAHSAPLGLAFNFGSNFPAQYNGDLFVAYHGSWNRKEKTGYKIVRIDLETKQIHDFATGWLTKEGKVLGRPVDIIFGKEGVMYASDDNAGVIYRVWYDG
ncbi:PQQ-dependent sugar dehydrogenase [Candidatus Woesearchaeota archaeon]|nr:PQQ-dependent sugar dehydrogenase [Candidatus Woesearchaeota archaeon]